MDEDMKEPVAHLVNLEPETRGDKPLDRMSATVEIYQWLHQYGYSTKVRVWIPRREASLDDLRKDAFQEAKRFLEASLKVLGS